MCRSPDAVNGTGELRQAAAGDCGQDRMDRARNHPETLPYAAKAPQRMPLRQLLGWTIGAVGLSLAACIAEAQDAMTLIVCLELPVAAVKDLVASRLFAPTGWTEHVLGIGHGVLYFEAVLSPIFLRPCKQQPDNWCLSLGLHALCSCVAAVYLGIPFFFPNFFGLGL